jgi:putative copper resistance protein D
MIAAGFIVARFVQFASLAVLIGIAWSPAYADVLSIDRSLARARRWAAILAVVSAVAWFQLTVARMADAPSAAIDPATLWMTVKDTQFGHVWTARLVGLLALLGVVGFRGARWRWVSLVLSGLSLASLALTGHAQSETGAPRWLHASADAMHLLAAGLWLGGLVVLGLLLAATARTSPAEADRALRRFSKTGIAAVAVLVGTGLVNSIFLVGTPLELLTTSYGRILTVKLAIFTGMVALAALNRRASERPSETLRPFRRRVILEQVLGASMIACVAVLGTIAPAAEAANRGSSYASAWPRASTDRSRYARVPKGSSTRRAGLFLRHEALTWV